MESTGPAPLNCRRWSSSIRRAPDPETCECWARPKGRGHRCRQGCGWGRLVPLLPAPSAIGNWSSVGCWGAQNHVMLCDAALDKAVWEGLQERVIGAVTRLDGGGLTHGRTDGSHP
ncbi:hypothetical protein NDU88_001084 [Pleurodeles waltl]|uniref:Uncharacterized protein n=1 Tax=Pleurodeles waltl TaxID=8319 RepID=A0AAV7U6J3_PLEWA|nr:hypothetical protein NDU88_001084 [Pleurodeles waltl]